MINEEKEKDGMKAKKRGEEDKTSISVSVPKQENKLIKHRLQPYERTPGKGEDQRIILDQRCTVHALNAQD